MPCAPAAANAFRSAWMPGAAAAVGARDRQRSRNHCAPFAGTSRIRFDGCDLSPVGAPRWPEASIGRVSVDVLRWEGLLERRGAGAPRHRAGPRGALRGAPGRARLRACAARSACRSSTPTSARPGMRRARGEHVLVTTGTASGKTLAFNLPVLDELARRPEEPRALPLSDEGARAGPVPHARRRCASRGSAGDLRRRHAGRAAPADPQAWRT